MTSETEPTIRLLMRPIKRVHDLPLDVRRERLEPFVNRDVVVELIGGSLRCGRLLVIADMETARRPNQLVVLQDGSQYLAIFTSRIKEVTPAWTPPADANAKLAEATRQAGTCGGCGRPAVPWQCRCGNAC